MQEPAQSSQLAPGSPEWMRLMTASKVAAVCGLSPWESRFSLWCRMAGLVPAEQDTPVLRRGRYLEPAIVAWWADQHPSFILRPGGTWVHPEDHRFAASPDRIVWLDESRCLEVKTSTADDQWGAEGTDQIPPHYFVQCQWQMECTGTRVCHVALLDAWLTFRQYVVEYDPQEAAGLRAEAAAFMDSLPWGATPQRPDLDAHGATYQAIRQLHPGIEDRDVQVPSDVAFEFLESRQGLKAAERYAQLCTTRIAELMGTARRARYHDHTIATRQAKGDGTPYLVAGRNLPTFTEESYES